MNLYQQRILEARKSFLKLNKEQEEELLRVYQELAKQLSSDIVSCRTSSSEKYLTNLNKMLQINIDKLNTKLNSTIKSNIETSSQIASAVDLAYYESITDDAKLRTMFNRLVVNTSMNTVKKLIQGNYYADGKTLDQRIWNITKSNAKDIDTFIKVNVAKGANAKELAKQVERYVNPSKSMIIKNDYVGFNKNISYQSARLARTSITHAFSETTIQNAKRNPFCKGIKWNLSASHSARMHGKMDMCDDYSGRVFKPNEVPLQHPNCLCYFTEENEEIDKVIDELKAWVNGEENSKLDKWLDDYDSQYVINNKNRMQVSKELAVSKEEKNSIIRVDNPKNKISNYEHKISNVKWNNYLNISEDNSNKLNEIHSSLNEFMHINNREKLSILNLETNNIVHELEGSTNNEVKLTKETKAVLKASKKNSIVFVHNHPSKTTFSSHDIYQIIKYKSINTMTLECYDGSKFILERGSMESSIANKFFFPSKYDQVYWKVAEGYPELNDEVKKYEVWDEFLYNVTKEIAQVYGMKYKKVIE